MSSNIQRKLANIQWKVLHEYRDKLIANQYTANPILANADVQALEAKLTRVGSIPAITEDINLLISLIRDQTTPIPDPSERAPVLIGERHSDNPCGTLYDPCTREPLVDFRALELRVNELRRTNDVIPTGLYGLTNTTTNYDFLFGPFLDKSITLDDFVSFRLGTGGQQGSDMYEVLSRLFVFFGGVPGVNPQQGGNFSFKQKIEEVAAPVFANPHTAFMNMTCKATSKSGVSDITLVRTAAGSTPLASAYCESACATGPVERDVQTYLMSVKWYRKERSAEHYDLEKLKATADAILTPEQRPYDIIVFLKSKREFERAHQRAYRQYIRHIGRTFFGWEEDVKPFLQDIRRQIFEEAERRAVTPATVLEEQYFQAGAKPVLNLQLHQEIITEAVCNALSTNRDNRYLVGVLPRGGKTYIAGGIIREYIRRTESRSLNILWLTAAPTETLSQVGRDLIARFRDFAEFEFINVRDTPILKKTKPYSFFFCSTQILTAKAGPEGRKRTYLNTLLKDASSLGLIFFDEAHKTGTGVKTREEIDLIFEAYQEVNIPFIFLTATYYNILFDYKILMDNTFIWDYTDVLKTRGLATESEKDAAIANLETRFRSKELVQGIIDRRIANGETLVAMGTPYLNFPDLYFISADFQDEALERFGVQNVYRPDAGFNMKSLFAIRDTATLADIRTTDGRIRADAYKAFANLVNPRNIVSLLTPAAVGFADDEEGGEPLAKAAGVPLEPSILGRIGAMSADAKSRFRIDESPTLLMFMPVGGDGSNIYFTLCAWASLLMAHPWWAARYEVACVVDSPVSVEGGDAPASNAIRVLSADPKAEILALERRLHCPADGQQPKGLIVLAGQKLSMGVSLPCTDVVFLFNDSKSPDDIVQKMYRALTPSIDKRAAFVVDLNPVRSLAAVYGYTRAASGESMTQSSILDILYDTYSWDADYFDVSLSKGAESRPQTFQGRLRQLFEDAEKDPAYRIQEDFGGIDRTAGQNIKTFVTDDRLLRVVTEYFSDRRVAGGGFKLELRDGAKASLKSGQLVIRTTPEETATAAGGGGPPPEEIIIENFVESVKDFVKYLAITTTAGTLDQAVEQYVSDAALQHNVNDLMVSRGVITRADPRIVEVFVLTVRELSKHSRGLMRMYGDTKSQIDEPSIRKNAILKMIHNRLTPRQRQKKDFGEVFTPIELVEEMLSHLPASIWKNPDLKWLDPANGIGNFPVVVFYKLYEGLKDVIPNEKARKKHIIENMLYMAELQSSNSRIARNIFNKLCDGCEPNIWTVDTLSKTPSEIYRYFNVDAFDIVIGNPPFQAFQEAGGKRGGGDELYMKFVRHSIDLLKPNGHLVFVHPPSWRKPSYSEGKKVSKNEGMFKLMTHDNQMVYLSIHNSSDGQKIFKASTRYDYYYLVKHAANKSTTIKDELGNIITVDLRNVEFLPNYNIANIFNLLAAGEDKCALNDCILYERSAYGTDKSWVSMTKTAEFKYPLIHSTPKTGPRILYTNDSTKAFFGIPKVIFGDSGINEPIIDMEGEYGMTQHAMALRINSKAEADRLVAFLKSNYFTNILQSCMWSSFQIDWRLFTYFKNRFWMVDRNLDEALIPSQGGGGRKLRKTRKIRRVM